MSKWWWIFALMTWTSVAQAEAPVGVAYFSINKFTPKQCRVALSVFKDTEKPFLSILWHGFGTDDSCVKKFLADPRPKTLMIHPFNTTCSHAFRRGSCGHEPNWNRASNRLKRIQEIHAFLAQNASSNTRILISLGLEDTFQKKAARALTQVLQSFFPRIVRSTLHESQLGAVPGISLNELHGVQFPRTSKARLLSNDGYDICSTVRPTHRNCLSVSRMHDIIRKNKRSKDYFVIWWNTHGVNPGDGIVDPFLRRVRIYRKDVNTVREILNAH